MDFARDVADRIVFMDQGAIVEEGPPAVVFSAPRSPRTKQFLHSVLNRNGSVEGSFPSDQVDNNRGTT
jgi:ABC-type glutathione transport system ATPase component